MEKAKLLFAMKDAIKMTIQSNPELSNKNKFWNKNPTPQQILQKIINSDVLVSVLFKQLIDKVLGPYILFLARLLEELKSSTLLSELIKEDAYEYLELYGLVCMMNNITTVSQISSPNPINITSWRLENVDWYFDSSKQVNIYEINTLQEIIDTWDGTFTNHFRDYYSFKDAASVQILALAKLLLNEIQRDNITFLNPNFTQHQSKDKRIGKDSLNLI